MGGGSFSVWKHVLQHRQQVLLLLFKKPQKLHLILFYKIWNILKSEKKNDTKTQTLFPPSLVVLFPTKVFSLFTQGYGKEHLKPRRSRCRQENILPGALAAASKIMAMLLCNQIVLSCSRKMPLFMASGTELSALSMLDQCSSPGPLHSPLLTF